ncbi:hypothetical protein [Streptomyces sp. NPDC048191]|uniref:hypothetical protein n=1 Tax=Streptomyces sp. NPDC048191 TaxID=3155484 RepID=UPI0033C06B71
MRKFQRVAVVAAAIAGLSAFGGGVSFAAGGEDAPPQITAVANSTANAVAVGGNNTTETEPKAGQEAGPQDEGNSGPEQGDDQHQGDE